MAIGIVGLFVTLGLCALKIGSTKPQKRMEALEDIKIKALLAILLFSMPVLLGMLMRMVVELV